LINTLKQDFYKKVCPTIGLSVGCVPALKHII